MIKRVLLGVVLVVGALIWTIPAEQLLYRVLPGSADLHLYGVQGTVWSGSAKRGRWRELQLADVNWSLRPLQLFLLRLGYDIDANTDGGTADGNVAVTVGGATKLNDVTVVAPWADLKPLLVGAAPMSAAIPLDGIVRAELDSLTISDGLVSDTEGVLTLGGVTLPDKAGPIPIGTFVAEVRSEAENLIAEFTDEDAAIGLTGRFSLEAGKAWRFNAVLKPGDKTPQQLKTVLALAERNRRGENYVFQQSGRLP